MTFLQPCLVLLQAQLCVFPLLTFFARLPIWRQLMHMTSNASAEAFVPDRRGSWFGGICDDPEAEVAAAMSATRASKFRLFPEAMA
jgi:hypothetical protein